jgi:hypothetical protein
MGNGKEYLSWLNEDERSKWINNFRLMKFHMPMDEFLESKVNWVSFICGSFPFKDTPEGPDYWIEIYSKYKRYDNLNVKKGFNSFSKQPKII